MKSSYIGKVIDNYRILEILGIGGMGIVFKAVNIKLDKTVALKMISPGMAMNEKYIRRFQIEAKNLAKMADPNIVDIYDLRSDNDQWFIIMEYVNGKNISDSIKQTGVFSIEKSIYVMKQILSAVGHAHKSNIIHRDLKPNNIMVTEEGVVKITDFGLAKMQSNILNTMTITGGGTLYYMPPEQIKDFTLTEKRSDVYSIGMCFFEMVTGKVPFENIDSDFDLRETIVHKELNKPSLYNKSIPQEIENIILKATAKNIDKRYQSAENMLQDIISYEKKTIRHNPNSTSTKQTKQESSAPNKNSLNSKNVAIKKSPFGKIALIILFASLFLITGYFLKNIFFTAAEKSNPKNEISIITSPKQAELFIDGTFSGKTPLSKLIIKRDKPLNISLVKNGYKRLDTTITVNKNSATQFSFKLNKLTTKKKNETILQKSKKEEKRESSYALSAISISSQPSNAKVLINNKLRGTTPLEINDISPGKYELSIQTEGYETFTEELELAAGDDKKINKDLIPVKGTIIIKTQPPTAAIYVDNMIFAAKEQPIEINNLNLGEHTVSISEKGYETYSAKIIITADKTTNINVNLVQAIGKVVILVKPWGSIYIDNQLKKESASFANKFELSSGKHIFKITHPSLGYWQKEMEIKTNIITNIVVDFNRKFNLNISAKDKNDQPIYGTIFIDGRDSGEITPKQISLNTGLHKITVKKDGFVTATGTKELLITKDIMEPIIFILKRIK